MQSLPFNQAFGWAQYSFSLLGSVLVASNLDLLPYAASGLLSILGFLGFLSQICINLSVGQFRQQMSSPKRERAPSFRQHQSIWWNGYTKTSLLLSLLALFAFVLSEGFQARGRSNDEAIITLSANVGTLCFCAAAAVTHFLNGRQVPGYPSTLFVFKEGDYGFLLLHCFSWILLAVMLQFTFLLPVVGNRHMMTAEICSNEMAYGIV